MPAATQRTLGVTVLPEFLQNETIDGVLDRLTQVAGVTAVTTSPYVMAPADEGTGGREPPDDAGAGEVRLLDRSLWGRRELFVRTAPSFEPDRRLYAGLRYQPAEPNDLTRESGAIVGEFIRAAQGRHLDVYLQVQAAIPPGYRVQFGGPIDEDIPRLPDGRIPPRRLSKNGSLGSPHIIAYLQALLRDLTRVYPHVTGFRIDWPEYPPYFLDDCFLDFGPHVEAVANELGIDFARMRRDAQLLYSRLHGELTDEDLHPWLEPDGGRYGLLEELRRSPGLVDLLELKGALCERLVRSARDTLREAAGPECKLLVHAFPPPLCLPSGIDFARLTPHCSGFCVKLYTMHLAMMLNSYGEALLKTNPTLTESLLVQALVRWFDIADDAGLPRLADYAYPGPDAPHPVGTQAQERKIRQAERAAGTTPAYTLVHGYGPASDFRRRLEAAWRTTTHGVWINRYGYLSDEKLAIVGAVCRRG